MPEGPEVKRMAMDLAEVVSNKTLESIEIISGRYTKKPAEGLSEIQSVLPTKVIGAGCHGKFMYMLTNSGFNIWCTLGMTGRWTKSNSGHVRARFKFSDGDYVNYEDTRNFGTLKFVYGKEEMIKKLKSLGPDLLSDPIDPEFFVQRIRDHNRKNITKVLMDQSIFSGVGNYVKAEALWLAKINPMKDVKQLEDHELLLLCETLKSVLSSSFESGGATFKSHKNFSGEAGDYSSRFLCYGRKQDAEGNPVEKMQTPDGRTTHWAPLKQGD